MDSSARLWRLIGALLTTVSGQGLLLKLKEGESISLLRDEIDGLEANKSIDSDKAETARQLTSVLQALETSLNEQGIDKTIALLTNRSSTAAVRPAQAMSIGSSSNTGQSAEQYLRETNDNYCQWEIDNKIHPLAAELHGECCQLRPDINNDPEAAEYFVKLATKIVTEPGFQRPLTESLPTMLDERHKG